MLERFIELSEKAIELTGTEYIRPSIEIFETKERLIGIKGTRGVGKTTLLLQYAKLRLNSNSRLYLSLDNPYFANNNLLELVDTFVKNGGENLLLDEVHHHREWSYYLKTIYDNYKNLKVFYTTSSLLHLSKGIADLSRRAVTHTLYGFSFREYLNLTLKTDFPEYSLSDIVNNHLEISKTVIDKIKPIKEYNKYNSIGYYPFFIENEQTYLFKMGEIINQVIESDLAIVAKISYSNVNKMKQLLQIISESVPFKPNLEKISTEIGISKNTLKDYLLYMHEAMLIYLLKSWKKNLSKLAKPEKIYIFHPNLMFALANENSNKGNIRESFFLNQVQAKHNIHYSEIGDFIVDNTLIFEIGGRNKSYKQIANAENSYLACDDLEIGYKNTIPLWLFGFIY